MSDVIAKHQTPVGELHVRSRDFFNQDNTSFSVVGHNGVHFSLRVYPNGPDGLCYTAVGGVIYLADGTVLE